MSKSFLNVPRFAVLLDLQGLILIPPLGPVNPGRRAWMKRALRYWVASSDDLFFLCFYLIIRWIFLLQSTYFKIRSSCTCNWNISNCAHHKDNGRTCLRCDKGQHHWVTVVPQTYDQSQISKCRTRKSWWLQQIWKSSPMSGIVVKYVKKSAQNTACSMFEKIELKPCYILSGIRLKSVRNKRADQMNAVHCEFVDFFKLFTVKYILWKTVLTPQWRPKYANFWRQTRLRMHTFAWNLFVFNRIDVRKILFHRW